MSTSMPLYRAEGAVVSGEERAEEKTDRMSERVKVKVM